MPRYKAIIAYDGTHFHGFQKQPNERTVQEEIEKTLARMNNGHSVTVFGSGRTDAGVHAMGQVIHFDYPQERPLEKMRFALDTQTPEDIAVRSVERVSEDFHARYHVIEKTYQFKVDIGKPRSPFRRFYASYFPYPIDLEKIQQALVGTLLKIGNGRLEPTAIPAIIAAKDRNLAGPTAHPEGLYLAEVKYEN